jgi:ArsR family transcriptional regulator, virulence genes transcriptional regulator
MSSISPDQRRQFIATSNRILTAMANASRLAILSLVIEREYAGGELGMAVGLSSSALSQHLAKLRRAGLVRTRRHAQTIFYSSSSIAAIKILTLLDDIAGSTPAAMAKRV